jgi:hypothetical protein
MRRLSFALLISVTFVALICAKEREWQTATVLKLIANGTETEAVVVPLPGGGAAGESTTSSGKHVRGVYWIKTEQFTYVIPNYCKSKCGGHTVVALSDCGWADKNLSRFGKNPSHCR